MKPSKPIYFNFRLIQLQSLVVILMPLLVSAAIPMMLALLVPMADQICMMMTRLACNRAIESSYWRMDNNSDVGLLMGYVLYRLLIELESMDLDTFSH
jgi:hypothetical protein